MDSIITAVTNTYTLQREVDESIQKILVRANLKLKRVLQQACVVKKDCEKRLLELDFAPAHIC
eukprot:SAG22_NODE_2271_length_2767_cov_2.952547_2_plen_63_part_00